MTKHSDRCDGRDTWKIADAGAKGMTDGVSQKRRGGMGLGLPRRASYQVAFELHQKRQNWYIRFRQGVIWKEEGRKKKMGGDKVPFSVVLTFYWKIPSFY